MSIVLMYYSMALKEQSDLKFALRLWHTFWNCVIAITFWIILGIYSDAKEHPKYVMPWILLLIYSLCSFIITIGNFCACGDDSEENKSGLYKLIELGPLAMYIWGWIMYDNNSGFKWSDFSNEYSVLATMIFVVLIVNTVAIGLILFCVCGGCFLAGAGSTKQSSLPV